MLFLLRQLQLISVQEIVVNGHATAAMRIMVPGTADHHQYVQYRQGDLPVILSVPHGGLLHPDSIPDRFCPVCSKSEDRGRPLPEAVIEGIQSRHHKQDDCPIAVMNDGYTLQFAEIMAEEMATALHGRPHLVINHLRRVKLDPNREPVIATLGHPKAMAAYDKYHNFIRATKRSFGDQRGILFDIHGQSRVEVIQLGYGISQTSLNDQNFDLQDSSIRSLAQIYPDPDKGQLIHGPTSLGGILQSLQFPSVPSPAMTAPGSGKYFSGGFIVQHHGSLKQGSVDAIQMELPRRLRLDCPLPQRIHFAKGVARAMANFVQTHYTGHPAPPGSSASCSGTHGSP